MPKPDNSVLKFGRGLKSFTLILTLVAGIALLTPRIARAAGSDDFDSGGDSISITGGVPNSDTTPSVDRDTAPSEASSPPGAAAADTAPSGSSEPAIPVSVTKPDFASDSPPSASIPAERAATTGVSEPARPSFNPLEHPLEAEPAPPESVNASVSEKPGSEAAAPAPPSVGSSESKAAATTVASKEPDSKGLTDFQFSSRHGPVDITSDSLAFDYKGKSANYIGHVHANQAGGQLTSDKLRVNFGENLHEVKEMFADGHVRISQGTQWATGEHAVLDQEKHTVVLTGNPIVHDGEDQITGSKITGHLDTSQFVVEHAHAVLFPKAKQNTEINTQIAPAEPASKTDSSDDSSTP